ncbi:MAG: ThuA domain-containing protein [Planctomycetaceae bacterium]|nr:ThuA domain-containing protein [Planctomycetaceae bacterium]
MQELTVRSWLALGLSIGVMLGTSPDSEAQPPSTIQTMPGLTLWLDPASLDAASDGISAWRSTAARDLTLTAPSPEQCPRRVVIGSAAVLRFDGIDDCLRIENTGLQTQSATVFLVAAPHSNAGGFPGLLAGNASGQRDYESGFCIDLGPGPTRRFDQLNVEGTGFGGAQDLLESGSPFGTLHILEVVIDAENSLISLTQDGKDQLTRPFRRRDVSLDQLTLGARYYTNGPGPQQVRSFMSGDIVELLIFDRVLSRDERSAVRRFLSDRHRELAEKLPQELQLDGTQGIELQMARNPPAIQMLIPGFAVQELPLELTNVNNVRYRDDGALVTLGYNGDIHLLRDTDGDGLEDHAELFWKNEGSLRGPIGMALTPPGYSRGRGVFVPSKGKVSLIVDTNGDDRADEEIIVASGWKEIFTTVDALGIALDADENIYFGLGVANFADAYQLGDDGKPAYDIHADNGTIQKVSADFSQRETVCTGIRFPVALAFNRRGDLFATEQEGATWLPNGNPLDELLHIRLNEKQTDGSPAGLRHFGFPPRHPRYNPAVIDEPSTFDFSPQHQSTCGMVFNESVNGGQVFGPKHWAGDAIICGESRGKIWRTRLMPTSAGYVASSQLIACLQMLTVDACVSPSGHLIVACHSGPPDWGTGPTGIGKLFRIQSRETAAPHPIAAWAQSPQEIHITFDQPLDPQSARGLTDGIRIEYGESVRAGDRFEHMRPPYAVVNAQQLQPRRELSVASAALTADLHTIVINTAPMRDNVHYAVTLPALSQLVDPEVAASTELHPDEMVSDLVQHPQIDVDFSLHGVLASWQASATESNDPHPSDTDKRMSHWSGWLPHPDLSVSEGLLRGSQEHLPLATCLQSDGQLTLEMAVDLHDFLRPAIQPGASIDYEWPDETTTLVLRSNQEIVVEAVERHPDGERSLNVVCERSDTDELTIHFQAPSNAEHPILVRITMVTEAGEKPNLTIGAFTNEDPRIRPLPLHRFGLPWVKVGASAETEQLTVAVPPELEGGSWGRGRRVFHSEAAGCFKCHSVGTGIANIGPNLSHLVARDYDSVLRDILRPGFAINPDYIGHVIETQDGRVLTGVLRTENGILLLGDAKGNVTPLRPSEIAVMSPAKSSVMPEGLLEKLTGQQQKDLLTYLLTPPPRMPLESPLPAPPLRTQAEVAAALSGAPPAPESVRPLFVVLVAGPKDHGPGEHDYPAWQQQWEELLTAGSNVTVSTAWEFPDDEQLAKADVLIFFQKGSFAEQRPEKLDAFLKRGGGAVYIHWAVNGNDQVQPFSERIGLASWGGRIRFRHGPLSLLMHSTDHPIMRNFDSLQLYDESYWLLTGNPANVTLLASSVEDDTPTPQMWVLDHQPGRVFVSIPGHYSWTFDDPLFRILLLRGIAWTAREPVDRFNELVPYGARMSR